MRVLVVAAHPDDEVLGCGGTVALLSRAGHEVFVLILGEGATARDEERDPEGRRAEIEALRRAARRAGEILGVREVFFASFPDNRFDTVPLLEVVKQVERVKAEVAPEEVLTHFPGDLNVDHRITAQAVLTATRPLPGEVVRRVLAFEVPSSTEWNFAASFRPNCYVDVSAGLAAKLEALSAYEAEMRPFPHPRSREGVEALARRRGTEVGVEAAEGFEVLRLVERPGARDEALDLAAELVRRHEGLSLRPYRDPVGKLTIGYGRNLEDVGISREEAEALLANDLRRCEEELRRLLGETYRGLSPVRRAVLLDMVYNLGLPAFSGFRRLIAALRRGDYEAAAEEMLASRWARQVGRRAEELAHLMRKGTKA